MILHQQQEEEVCETLDKDDMFDWWVAVSPAGHSPGRAFFLKTEALGLRLACKLQPQTEKPFPSNPRCLELDAECRVLQQRHSVHEQKDPLHILISHCDMYDFTAKESGHSHTAKNKDKRKHEFSLKMCVCLRMCLETNLEIIAIM